MSSPKAAVVFFLALALTGCDQLPAVFASHVRTEDVVIDNTPGSGITPRHVDEELSKKIPLVVDEPGSVLRLAVIGNTVAESRILATFTSTSPAQESLHARKLHRERELGRAKTTFDAVINQAFQTKPTRSPLFETAARFLTMPSVGEHTVTLLTDGRETALRDLECGPQPNPKEWVRFLQARGLFLPGTGGHLVLAYADLIPVANNRCSPTLDGYHKTIELWKQASNAAGVTFTNAPQGTDPQTAR